jgi:hypothetical protein
METYHYSHEARKTLESLQQPLAIYQAVDGKISTLLVSDGFCSLLGYEKREDEPAGRRVLPVFRGLCENVQGRRHQRAGENLAEHISEWKAKNLDLLRGKSGKLQL